MMTGFVCYCPDFRIYHYFRDEGGKGADGKPDSKGQFDYKFTQEELEAVIMAKLADNNEAEAKVLADVTSLGRLNPHKVVRFDGDGKVIIEDPVFPPDDDDPLPAGG